MRKAAIGIAAVAAMIGTPVLAADMAVKAPPLPAPVYSWTGGYIGANGGYGWGGWNSNSLAAIFPDGVTTTADPDVHGWFGGVTAGYNWQTSPQWVVGIEGDFDWTGERASDGSNASTTGPGPSTGFCDFGGGCSIITATTSANDWRKLWFATLRGRVGFLIEPTWLLYGPRYRVCGHKIFNVVVHHREHCQECYRSGRFFDDHGRIPFGVIRIASASRSVAESKSCSPNIGP